MATIINFIATTLLAASMTFGPVEIADAKRVDIQNWYNDGTPAQVVCTKEEGGEWDVFLAVTQEMDPDEITVKGNVHDIEMTMTVSFEADDEAIMDMITLARRQGATVEVS